MPEQKTKPTQISVEKFLEDISDETVRGDCQALAKMMKSITRAEPAMWGTSIVGFGRYHYKYESGHEGYSCLTGFSPRKQNITVYVMPGFSEHPDLLNNLGKYKAGKGCLYIKRLADIDKAVLEKLIKHSVAHLEEKYG